MTPLCSTSCARLAWPWSFAVNRSSRSRMPAMAFRRSRHLPLSDALPAEACAGTTRCARVAMGRSSRAGAPIPHQHVSNSPRGEFSQGTPGFRSADDRPVAAGRPGDTPRATGTHEPKTSSASCTLCGLHRREMFAAVASPPMACGSRWWNSRKARSVHRRPPGATKAHRPPSRSHTSRLTRAGMWRDRVPAAMPGLGFDVASSFFRATSSSRSVSARSKIAAGSPSGISRRRSSWTRRSFSCVASPTVNCTR